MNILNKVLVPSISVLPKGVVKLFANKYIAGDKLSDAVSTVKSLNLKKLMATVDVLGESIKEKSEAVNSKNENLKVLDAINENQLNCNLSIKLTMLGLNIDYDFCREQVYEILEKAKSINTFVRIDMEDSSVTESTIKIFEESKKKFGNVGIVKKIY